MDKNKLLSVKVSSWNSFRKLADFLSLWHFRGQSDASWELSTSMERNSIMFKPLIILELIEKGIIHQFQRRAHHYVSHLPKENSYLEWLAMLQHYGCPTRLLDFTHSFYVATFFAVETAICDSAVWAVNHDSIKDALATKLNITPTKGMSSNDANRRNISLVESYIGCKKREHNFVVDIEPEFMTERLSIQQGLFLFPLNAALPFMNNLLSTFSISNEQHLECLNNPISSDDVTRNQINSASIIKFILPIGCHGTIIHDLHNMNINAATLFPGLDGYARSLKISYRSFIDDDWNKNMNEYILKGLKSQNNKL